MRKISSYILLLLVFVSCDYFQLQEQGLPTKKPIAIIDNIKLYKKDIADFFPNNITKNDSLVLQKSLINKWAIKQLLLKKSKENSTEKENKNVNSLVQNYKQSLLINNYKERLVKQQLDTVISDEELHKFYSENQQNFKLNEELVKIKYLHFGNDMVDEKDIINLFKSEELEDLETLESQQLSFKSFHLNESIWLPLDNVLLKIPFTKEKLLKKSKFNQKEDSLGLYLVAVKDVLKRNDIAPLSYILPTVKQMILHKRKLELIRDIEKIIIKDAVQNESFKMY